LLASVKAKHFGCPVEVPYTMIVLVLLTEGANYGTFVGHPTLDVLQTICILTSILVYLAVDPLKTALGIISHSPAISSGSPMLSSPSVDSLHFAAMTHLIVVDPYLAIAVEPPNL
jgi:hypothetical protein